MSALLRKEMKLSASVLSYLFIAFGLMFLLPGYPVLCGAFFVTLGIFQSFQNAREANDTVFSALLPVAKRDVVRGKYLFVSIIELAGFFVMAVCVLLRETVLAEAGPYKTNALMNANAFALGMALVIFGLFNLIFVRGYYRTGYKFAKPFVTYVALCFLCIGAAEAAHYFPGCAALNASVSSAPALQTGLLVAGAAVYALLTFLACRRAEKLFERVDL